MSLAHPAPLRWHGPRRVDLGSHYAQVQAVNAARADEIKLHQTTQSAAQTQPAPPAAAADTLTPTQPLPPVKTPATVPVLGISMAAAVPAVPPLPLPTQRPSLDNFDEETVLTTAAYVQSFGALSTPHFKYNFLSSGRPYAQRRVGMPATHRPQIMDATRSFIELPENAQERQTRRYLEAQRDYVAAGLGYGVKHRAYHRYLSKDMPPRPVEPFTARPCIYPTATLPPVRPLPTFPAVAEYDIAERDRRDYIVQCASGLGYGYKFPTYSGYMSNTFWR